MPLNPGVPGNHNNNNNNMGPSPLSSGGVAKMGSAPFDPISSMAQMSQQLTSQVGPGPPMSSSPPPSSMMMGGPNGMMGGPNMMQFNPSMHNMQGMQQQQQQQQQQQMSDPNSMNMMMGPGNGPTGPGMVRFFLLFFHIWK
jgi:hypothetical protein